MQPNYPVPTSGAVQGVANSVLNTPVEKLLKNKLLVLESLLRILLLITRGRKLNFTKSFKFLFPF